MDLLGGVRWELGCRFPSEPSQTESWSRLNPAKSDFFHFSFFFLNSFLHSLLLPLTISYLLTASSEGEGSSFFFSPARHMRSMEFNRLQRSGALRLFLFYFYFYSLGLHVLGFILLLVKRRASEPTHSKAVEGGQETRSAIQRTAVGLPPPFHALHLYGSRRKRSRAPPVSRRPETKQNKKQKSSHMRSYIPGKAKAIGYVSNNYQRK